MKACNHCGAQNAAGAMFCDSCGAKMANTCTACGTMLTQGAAFCDVCGSKVGAKTSRSTTRNSGGSTSTNSGSTYNSGSTTYSGGSSNINNATTGSSAAGIVAVLASVIGAILVVYVVFKVMTGMSVASYIGGGIALWWHSGKVLLAVILAVVGIICGYVSTSGGKEDSCGSWGKGLGWLIVAAIVGFYIFLKLK